MNGTDDGIGISPEDMERIFEPFYTKKEMDRSGTGLSKYYDKDSDSSTTDPQRNFLISYYAPHFY